MGLYNRHPTMVLILQGELFSANTAFILNFCMALYRSSYHNQRIHLAKPPHFISVLYLSLFPLAALLFNSRLPEPLNNYSHLIKDENSCSDYQRLTIFSIFLFTLRIPISLVQVSLSQTISPSLFIYLLCCKVTIAALAVLLSIEVPLSISLTA